MSGGGSWYLVGVSRCLRDIVMSREMNEIRQGLREHGRAG